MSNKRETAFHLGFIAYVKEDYEQAEEQWKRMFIADPFFRYAESQNMGSAYNRLLKNLKYNRGALYATTEEMKMFNGKQKRLAVMLGDISYENANPRKALRFYQDLLNEKYGKLSGGKKAFVEYAKAACLCYLGDHGEGLKYLYEKKDVFRNTPTEARALMGIANLEFSGGSFEDALRSYKRLQNVCSKSEESRRSLLYCGWVCEKMGKEREALRYYNKYRSLDKTSGLASYAEVKIKDLEGDINGI